MSMKGVEDVDDSSSQVNRSSPVSSDQLFCDALSVFLLFQKKKRIEEQDGPVSSDYNI